MDNNNANRWAIMVDPDLMPDGSPIIDFNGSYADALAISTLLHGKPGMVLAVVETNIVDYLEPDEVGRQDCDLPPGWDAEDLRMAQEEAAQDAHDAWMGQ